MESSEFYRSKAAQCRQIATGTGDSTITARRLLALALELDARAVALDAGEATSREMNVATPPAMAHTDGDGHAET